MYNMFHIVTVRTSNSLKIRSLHSTFLHELFIFILDRISEMLGPIT